MLQQLKQQVVRLVLGGLVFRERLTERIFFVSFDVVENRREKTATRCRNEPMEKISVKGCIVDRVDGAPCKFNFDR